MRKARTFLILGICITILPYLGFPYFWKDIFFTILGIILIYFSYLLYRDYKKRELRKNLFDNFRENSDFEQDNKEGTVQLAEEVAEIEISNTLN